MRPFTQILLVAAALAACLGAARADHEGGDQSCGVGDLVLGFGGGPCGYVFSNGADPAAGVTTWNSLQFNVQRRTCDDTGCTFNDVGVPTKKKVCPPTTPPPPSARAPPPAPHASRRRRSATVARAARPRARLSMTSLLRSSSR
jgi:hypothetical protein